MKLGRVKPTPAHRRRALPLARYLAAPLPPAPPSLDNSKGVAYGLFRNDQIGDCTCAALANYFLTCAAADGRQISFSDDEVAAFYYSLTGGEDIGLTEIDVLEQAQRAGFPLSGEHKLDAWVRIDHGDLASLRACAFLFRAIYVGAELPIRARGAALWDATGAMDGDDAPGGWGGHALIIPAYDENVVRFRTWGREQPATWAWVREYVTDAYALLDAERAQAAGVDWERLRADLQALGGGA